MDFGTLPTANVCMLDCYSRYYSTSIVECRMRTLMSVTPPCLLSDSFPFTFRWLITFFDHSNATFAAIILILGILSFFLDTPCLLQAAVDSQTSCLKLMMNAV